MEFEPLDVAPQGGIDLSVACLARGAGVLAEVGQLLDHQPVAIAAIEQAELQQDRALEQRSHPERPDGEARGRAQER